MWTIDTSVWVSASEPTQAHHAESRAMLHALRQRGASIVLPNLLLVELSGAIARLRSVTRAGQAVRIVRQLPAITFVALDDALAERARQLAATHRLRGADAVYAAVAQAWNTTLVSLDNEHLTRLPPVVSVLTPDAALRQLQP